MQSEFEAACASARNEISVPQFSLAAIRARNEQVTPSRRGRRSTFAAIGLGLSMAAIAAAAVIDHAQFSITKSGGLVVSAPAIKIISRASNADVASIAAKLNFNVTLPQALPQGTNLNNVIDFSPDGIALNYDVPGAWRRSHHYMNVIIVNPSALKSTSPAKQRMSMMLALGHRPTVKFKNRTASIWHIGQEDVIIQTSVLTKAEAAKIKAAMQKEAAR